MLNYRHNAISNDDVSVYPGIEHLESHERDNYPISLSIDDDGCSLTVTAAVASPVDPYRICGYMQRALQSLAEALDHSQGTVVQRLEILPSEERQLLLQTWNATQEDYPSHLCIHHVIEQQAEHTPEATALVSEGQSLTYSQLNERSNRLAHHLIRLGVVPDMLVAICVERSPSLVIGILAILKSGGAFVPLDPAYAGERIRGILTDAAPSVVVVDETGRMALGEEALSSVKVVDLGTSEYLDDEAKRMELEDPSLNPHVMGLTSQHLAYIIYTSGSTGKPKGVMIEHRGVVNLTSTHAKFCDVNQDSRVLQFASCGFDASVSEILLPLTSGARLYLPPSIVRQGRDELWNYMAKHKITLAVLTPTFLQDGKDLPKHDMPLTLVLGGEALGRTLLQNLITQGCTVINDYGPTETTVSAISWFCSTEFKDDVVPIGRPIGNVRVYILDRHLQPVPLGAAGEMYIGGPGVARGYLNRPDMTADRFLQDPFASDTESRMYRTGDLVQYLPDGNIVYLGRNDDQIKIRGFRIEPGEIEARLSEHPLVQKAAVFALGEGVNKKLVAYV
ncbi:hypothetical protein BGX31_003640, partial [Mortierella sp. GBA43]